jgi:hypothetical protein
MPIIFSSPKLQRKYSNDKSKVKYCMFLILGLGKFKAITSSSTATFGFLSFQNIATSSFPVIRRVTSPIRTSTVCSFVHSNIQSSYRMALSQEGTSVKNHSTAATSLYEMTKAKYISSSDESLKDAGERLRSGLSCSFPTETVYVWDVMPLIQLLCREYLMQRKDH